jgi:hypothetical protein
MPFKIKKRERVTNRNRTLVVNLKPTDLELLRQHATESNKSMSELALDMLEYGRCRIKPRPPKDKETHLTFWVTDEFYDVVKREAKKRRWPVRAFVRQVLLDCMQDLNKGA